MWDELLLMVKLGYSRPTMSEMVGMDVLYQKLSSNLSVVVVVSRHVSWKCLVGPQPNVGGYQRWLMGMSL